MNESFSDVVIESFQNLWTRFIEFLPTLVAALLVLIIGWAVAGRIGWIVRKIIEKVWIDQAMERIRIPEALQKAGFQLSASKAIGFLVKWFLIFVVLLATSNILGLEQLTNFLDRVVFYIPNVVIAVVILLLGFLFASWMNSLVATSMRAGGFSSAGFVASVAKWAILVFAILAALVQLQIAESLLNTLFTGFVAMLALAGGLAFGLGGKEHAKEAIERLKKDFGPHRG